ncbi:hypothetical protein KC19_12G164800 [Ceratodon purpureus]|uniref:Secreted protein n=1 Tax=Ceratodon purpureus TaxID=3225 RepID=A0A8T0G8J2_CERPU|nr:hypothetical protein KC19_12G164800 [Ceratodon purpureus]
MLTLRTWQALILLITSHAQTKAHLKPRTPREKEKENEKTKPGSRRAGHGHRSSKHRQTLRVMRIYIIPSSHHPDLT